MQGTEILPMLSERCGRRGFFSLTHNFFVTEVFVCVCVCVCVCYGFFPLGYVRHTKN